MHRLAAGLALAVLAFGAPSIPPTRPEVQGVFPHGGQRGTDVNLLIRGKNLQGATEVLFARPGLSAVILKVEHNRIQARFHIDVSAETGRHDFRIVAPHGSTINWFDVSDRKEIFEKEPNDDRQHAQEIRLPVLLNGGVKAGDYDYFRFAAEAGHTVTFDVLSTRNGSQFDPVIDLLDENGSLLDYSDDYYMFKDPHLVFTFAREGIYYLRVYGSGESGSDNADYRLTAGEMPQVDYAMPGGGRQGDTVEIELAGVNLASVSKVTLGDGAAAGEVVSKSATRTKVRMRIPPNLAAGEYRLHVESSDQGAATVPASFVVSTLSEITVRGKAARRKADPLPVQLPVIANGVLGQARAADYFSFRVDAPETVVLQVDSMQLGFLLDPMVAIYDESGARIAWQDEPTTNTGRKPANLDPHLVFHLPKAGRYTAMVRDSQYRGDPNYVYRFTLKPAKPDFIATIVGTDETLFRGRENVVTVVVRRLEGWNTPVEITAENLPAGVSAKPVIAPPVNTPYKNTCGEDHVLDGTSVEIPLVVDGAAPGSLSQIRFHARGVMDGKTVEHEAAARYWWKIRQNVVGYAETRPLYATIADAPQLVLTTPDRVAVAQGKSAKIKVVIARMDDGNQPLEIGAEPEAGLAVETATVAPGGTLAEIQVTNSAAGPARITLVGKVGGKPIGYSHPIAIDSTGKPESKEVADEN
jgi:Bacterial pre-peptidase C-terminal domain/Quinohemoprotein amine dehydrogenase, alpha subunit domain III